jgi:dipeptidyl aminopeptidase/acylaminoacyl peptidase
MYFTPAPLLEVTNATAERISFTTSDGVKIKANYYVPNSGGSVPVFILSHQNNANRSQFNFLVPWMLENGFAVLAYDTRGFGKSGGERSDYIHGPYDVVAAIDYLEKDSRIQDQKMYALGSSMGANIVYAAAALDPRLSYVMSLSPDSTLAMNTMTEVKAVNRPQNITIVATEEDSFSSPQAMHEYAGYPKQLIMYKGNRHGIQLLQGVKRDELLAILLKLK